MTDNTGTVRLHRVLASTPERVFRAFTTAGGMCKWLPPHGFTGEVQLLEPRKGGRHHMSFTNLTTGASHGFGGEYLEFEPDRRLQYTDRFDDPGLPGEMRVTVELTPVTVGVELNIVQEGIPAAIPVEACYLGWQQSLTLLAQLVEPEIRE